MKKRFALVSIVPKTQTEEQSLKTVEELGELVESLDGEVIEIILQKREIHDKGGYIGSGKVEEISQIILDKKIDVVVLNAIVKAGQIYELFEIWSKVKKNIEVWDRVDLILKIFESRADTAEAKLQIELAAMRHMGPRIYGMGLELSRQGGGVGTRGIGETNTEIMKRHLREQEKKTRLRLEKLTRSRQAQLKRRQEIGLKTVSLVGYTNAGKTSLFNLLTGKKKLVENKLFATLDATVGPIYLPPIKSEILVSDTIGFIRDLPPELIEAFKSTLMESIYADLLLHIVDASDPNFESKIKVVEEILQELNLKDKTIILVFNKVDLVTKDFKKKLKKYPKSLLISTQTKEGISELIKTIESYLSTLQISLINQ